MYNYFKSVCDCDRSPVVICDKNHTIIYMNSSACLRYAKSGGEALIGKSLLNCHGNKSNEMIKKIAEWFEEDPKNNMIYTSRNDSENKDVYTVALRNECGELIGYYEKHEYRDRETASLYDFSKSLI